MIRVLRCCQTSAPERTRILFSTTSAFLQDVVHSGNSLESRFDTDSAFTPPSILTRSLPLLTSRKLEFPSPKPTKQAWLETMAQVEDEKFGMVDLHPEIFGVFPRIDILWWNIYWQRLYKHVDYSFVKNRAEMRGGGRKPWAQKGTGRARHGSIRSPLWNKGGKARGPRGPKTYFFMLPTSMRVLGLRTALSVKFAQDNLHIVDSLDLPNGDPKYLEHVVENKNWGLSVLFVDDTDILPRNMAEATDQIKQYNVMPVYGLNVYSMLKHETLVLTLAALEKLESKLLQQIHNEHWKDTKFSRYSTEL